jgi:hypothetical protein
MALPTPNRPAPEPLGQHPLPSDVPAVIEGPPGHAERVVRDARWRAANERGRAQLEKNVARGLIHRNFLTTDSLLETRQLCWTCADPIKGVGFPDRHSVGKVNCRSCAGDRADDLIRVVDEE